MPLMGGIFTLNPNPFGVADPNANPFAPSLNSTASHLRIFGGEAMAFNEGANGLALGSPRRGQGEGKVSLWKKNPLPQRDKGLG